MVMDQWSKEGSDCFVKSEWGLAHFNIFKGPVSKMGRSRFSVGSSVKNNKTPTLNGGKEVCLRKNTTRL